MVVSSTVFSVVVGDFLPMRYSSLRFLFQVVG